MTYLTDALAPVSTRVLTKRAFRATRQPRDSAARGDRHLRRGVPSRPRRGRERRASAPPRVLLPPAPSALRPRTADGARVGGEVRARAALLARRRGVRRGASPYQRAEAPFASLR